MPERQPFLHGVMARPNHDEAAREQAWLSLKLFMTDQVYPGDELVFERKVKPAFVREHGRAPKDRHEVRAVMERENSNHMWGSISRTLQEMMWDNVGSCVERQLPELIDLARPKKKPLGSLTLGHGFEVPRYISAIDIHAMPGNYHGETATDDVFIGALYDRAAFYQTKGAVGPLCDSSGHGMVAAVRKFFPDLKPKRILQMGCSVGWQTLPFCDAFPEAEIHAIEIGAPMLRYAHARAEWFGKKVHFLQQNAERTDFPDGYFDLVWSGAMFHETSRKAALNVMRECHRLLPPGGATIHSDVADNRALTPHEAYMLAWDAYYNAEPVWGTWNDMNAFELTVAAGFERTKTFECWRSRSADGVVTFHDAPRDPSISNGGGIGRGHLWGARK